MDEEIAKYSDDLYTNKKEKLHMQELLTQKQADLSRMNDRLEGMRTTRPPYLIELEKAEMELTKVHQDYAKKHRSLSYLESQLRVGEAAVKRRNKEKERNLNVIQQIAQQEENEILIGGGAMAEQEDPFMTTPGPKAVGIPISDEKVGDTAEDEEYEEEEEPDKGEKQPPNTQVK